jgi:hypothetical protein
MISGNSALCVVALFWLFCERRKRNRPSRRIPVESINARSPASGTQQQIHGAPLEGEQFQVVAQWRRRWTVVVSDQYASSTVGSWAITGWS